jgi:hypothetical protein
LNAERVRFSVWQPRYRRILSLRPVALRPRISTGMPLSTSFLPKRSWLCNPLSEIQSKALESPPIDAKSTNRKSAYVIRTTDVGLSHSRTNLACEMLILDAAAALDDLNRAR